MSGKGMIYIPKVIQTSYRLTFVTWIHSILHTTAYNWKIQYMHSLYKYEKTNIKECYL